MVHFTPVLLDVVHLLPHLDVDDGGVKAEEDGEGQGDPLDDDPGHEAVELGLDEGGAHLLDLEGEDEPLGQVEEEEEDGDLAAGTLARQNGRGRKNL